MPSITLSELRTRVYNRLENNTRFYTQPEVDAAINGGICVLNLYTGFLNSKKQVISEAEVFEYDVPPEILIVTRVVFDGRELGRDSLKYQGMNDSSWMKYPSAAPGYWVPIGIRKIGICPPPLYAGSVIEMHGVSEPVEMSLPSDVIVFPNEYVDALELYASHYVQLKGGGAVAIKAMKGYQEFLGRMKRLKRYRASINPAFFFETGVQA